MSSEETPKIRIGRYVVSGGLGRGGMGVVLAAHDTELDRPVAIKLLHRDPSGSEQDAVVRLGSEAKAMAKLSHPNVVTVYEVGTVGGRPFIAMELVAGETLRAWRGARTRGWREVMQVLIATGRGLAAAHQIGLVHRDVKPENVLVGADGRPRVTDFGLVAIEATGGAEVPALAALLTSAGLSGTPAYMAPEQWRGEPVDARCDQYSFAVMCWEMLWGTRPVPDGTSGTGIVPPPRARLGVPRRAEAALRRALRREPGQRWLALSELLDELERLLRDGRLAVALGAAMAVVVLAISILAILAIRGGSGETESACASEPDPLAAIWNPARRRALAAGFARSSEMFAQQAWVDVEQRIDGWAAEHKGMQVEACHAKRSLGASLASLTAARERCLERRRGELAAFLTALEQPDQVTVRYARSTAHGLSRPLGCLTVQSDDLSTVVVPLAAREMLGSAHGRLAKATTLRALGKPREAVALAELVAREADAMGWAPLIAEAQLELGFAHQAANANAEGARAHARAALFADAAHDDHVRFSAMIGLSTAGMDHSEYDQASKHIESARMIARRLPPDHRREVSLSIQAASLAFWRGEYLVCVERARDTSGQIAQALGANAIEGAYVREKLAHCLYKLGHFQEAVAPLEEALAIATAAAGREHPLPADIQFGLGYVMLEHGELESALAHFRESLAIREQVLGRDNAMVGVSATGMGAALLNLGRLDEAWSSAERAIAVLSQAWGADSPAVATASALAGEIAEARGEQALAEKYLRRAVEILRAKRPPGHDEVLETVVKLGRVLITRRDRSALPVLREAVAAYAASPDASPATRANARFLLGRAMVEFGADRARGTALMQDACAVLSADPVSTRQAADCTARTRAANGSSGGGNAGR